MEEEKKIKDIDFRRSDLHMQALHNYYGNMNETKDTKNIVPPKHYKRIQNLIYKEYKYTVKQVKKNYKVVLRFERKEVLKEKLTALKDKIKAKIKALWDKIKSKFKKKSEEGQEAG